MSKTLQLSWYLLILLVIGVVLLFPEPSFASDRCCVKGPGDCYPHTDPDNMMCAFGYMLQYSNCDRISRCQQENTTVVKCCVCPPTTGSDLGLCLAPSEGNTPCAVPACQGSEKYCSEVDECIRWDQNRLASEEVDEDALGDPRTILFTPNVTIPGSKYFNQGEPIIVTGKTFGEYIAAFYFYFVSIAGILATVMMMYGGILYVISLGNQQKLSEAKDVITSSLIGLLIALGSYAILLLINPNLVKFDGIGVYKAISLPRYEQEVEAQGKSVYEGQQNISTFDKCLTDEAANNGIDRDWLKAMMLVESAANPSVVSSAGACGLIQLLPSTASDYEPNTSCEDLKDPWVNIRIAARHYKDLLTNPCPKSALYKSGRTATCYPERTNCKPGVHRWAVAAYNGGLKANCSSIEPQCGGQTWWECIKNAGFAETRSHVEKVTATHNKIVQAEQSPGAYPEFVWKDEDPSIPTCDELSSGSVPVPCPPVTISSPLAINVNEGIQTTYNIIANGGTINNYTANCPGGPGFLNTDSFDPSTGQLVITPTAGATANSPITCTISADNDCGNSSLVENLVVTVTVAGPCPDATDAIPPTVNQVATPLVGSVWKMVGGQRYARGTVNFDVQATDAPSGVGTIQIQFAGVPQQTCSAPVQCMSPFSCDYDWDTTTSADGVGIMVSSWFEDWLGNNNSNNFGLAWVDNSPPNMIGAVTDDGATTNDNTQLNASWSAANEPHVTDPNHVEYFYALGTAVFPNAGWDSITGWTSAGMGTLNISHPAAGLLTDGTTYHFSVKAFNATELESNVIGSDGITYNVCNDDGTCDAGEDNGNCPNDCPLGPCNDGVPPVITSLTMPADGSTISGTVPLSIQANDGAGCGMEAIVFELRSARFPIGHHYVLVSCLNATNCSYNWDTTGEAGGLYYLPDRIHIETRTSIRDLSTPTAGFAFNREHNVDNSGNCAPTITNPLPIIASASVGVPFNLQITANPGCSAITGYSLRPAVVVGDDNLYGLSIDPVTGLISGTPTDAINVQYFVEATDTAGRTGGAFIEIGS